MRGVAGHFIWTVYFLPVAGSQALAKNDGPNDLIRYALLEKDSQCDRSSWRGSGGSRVSARAEKTERWINNS